MRLTCKKGILFPVRRGEIRSVGGRVTCAGMGELQLFHAAVLFSFSDGSIALLFEGRNTFFGVFYFFVPGIGEIPAFAEPAAAIGKRPARDCLDAGGCFTVWNNAPLYHSGALFIVWFADTPNVQKNTLRLPIISAIIWVAIL